MLVYDNIATVKAVIEKKEELGWSDSKLAKVLGLSPTAIWKWRKGTASPSIDNLFRMASLFEVALTEITKGCEVESDFDLTA